PAEIANGNRSAHGYAARLDQEQRHSFALGRNESSVRQLNDAGNFALEIAERREIAQAAIGVFAGNDDLLDRARPIQVDDFRLNGKGERMPNYSVPIRGFGGQPGLNGKSESQCRGQTKS